MTTLVRHEPGAEGGASAPTVVPPAPASSAVAFVVALSAVGGAVAGSHPAGWGPADVAWSALAGAAVAWAGARASRVTVALVAVPGVVLMPGWARLVAVAALGLALAGPPLARARPTWEPVLAAISATASVQILLRLPRGHAWTALVAVAAVVPLVVSAWRASTGPTRRWMRIGALVIVGAMALCTMAFGAVAVLGHRSMRTGIWGAQRGLAAAEQDDPDGAARQLSTASAAFARAQDQFDAPWARAIRVVPVLGHYGEAATRLAAAGHEVAAAGAGAAGKISYDRITAHPGQIDLPLLASIVGPMSRVDHALRHASAQVHGMDTSWLLPPFTRLLGRYEEHLDSNLPESANALAAVRLAPALLGGEGVRHYLVLFANPAESRFLGGYAGAYGELTADHGKLSLTTSGRSEALAPVATDVASTGPAWPLALYRPQDHLGNVTAQVDFPAVGRLATQLFPDELGTPLDGVLYVDPEGLAALLGLTGGIQIDGADGYITEGNVATFLLHDQYTEFADRATRFDYLSEVAQTTFQALTTQSLPSPRRIFNQLDPVVRSGRLKLWLGDPRTPGLLRAVGMDGSAPRPGAGDLFDLRTSNTGQNKLDAFLHRDVSYRATVGASGAVATDVTVALRNDAPAGLDSYVASNWQLRAQQPGAPAFGTNSQLLMLTTSLALDGATVDGHPLALERHAGAAPGTTSYVAAVDVPLGATVEVHLRLHGIAARGRPYQVTFAHQPLAKDDRVAVSITRGPTHTQVGPFTLTETRTVSE